ncbi:MAG: arsenite methyltransferase [Candidatus Hodarchaeales archaeon]|jgi:ubiquinone/menaquinone biosynthesis C-methylase UbiE
MTEQKNVIQEESTVKSYQCCGSESKEQGETSTELSRVNKTNVHKSVREQYGAIASGTYDSSTDQEIENTSCCGDQEDYTGYSKEELAKIPEGANLGLGSGNPIRLAEIQSGETIVDLGSGGGIDCFLAAQKTGETGKVIGIDMTSQMIDKARANAERNDYQNVDFRLGEIEHMPVADNSVDLIVSNCVINLSVDKSQVFKEAFRILKPGGRVVVSDIMLQHEFPDVVKQALADSPGCVSRAWVTDDYLAAISSAGFEKVELIESQLIKPQKKYSNESNEGKRKRSIVVSGKKLEVELSPEEDERLQNSVLKAHVRAYKPQA